MSFLSPATFALAALLPLVVIMYLLKLRRTEQVVPSIFLWRRMVRDVEANAPWQKLRRNLLMFLQLLFLILLILVLAQPFIWTEGVSSQAAIFIIDNSASMGATDTPPNRLEAAKDQARRLVDSLPDDARITVITAAQNTQVLAASSLDRRQVYRAIEGIQLTHTTSSLTNALGLAAAVASRQPDAEVIILSDGRAELPERLTLRGRVRYYPIGMSGENQAINLLSLEPDAAGAGLTAFAQVANYGAETAARRLELYADGRLVNAYDLEIEAGGIQSIVHSDLAAETRQIEARLAGQDALPLDDRAWAVRPDREAVPLTLVTAGNRFLETVLRLLPGYEINTLTPAEFEAAGPAASGPASVTVFDGYVPITSTLPAGSLLFIAPPRSSEYFTVAGVIQQPALRIVDPLDPLVQHVSLEDISVLDAVQLPLPEWANRIVSGDTAEGSYPVLFAGQPGGRRVAVLAFDLRRSDLPLQVAFPLLTANLAGWLAPGSSGGLPEQVYPGSVIRLALPPEVSSVTVTRPDSSRVQVPVQDGQLVFAGTQSPGIYRVAWGSQGERAFAVNLFSPQESDVKPAGTLPVPGIEGSGQQERPLQGRRELWRPVAFAALLFLVLEWLVYQRAVIARLINNLRPGRPAGPAGRWPAGR
jgi:Ca-activated chloride channel homolog